MSRQRCWGPYAYLCLDHGGQWTYLRRVKTLRHRMPVWETTGDRQGRLTMARLAYFPDPKEWAWRWVTTITPDGEAVLERP